ncbi:MAG: toxin-antitoxin system HicB family antitoxin [bacterium]|nr:toxin-antitoxin system HicB family antitoxin [bacterium]
MNETTKPRRSGRFVLRIGADLHDALIDLAKDQGVSLNQYLQNLIARHLGGVETAEYAYQQAQARNLARMEKYSEIYLKAIEKQALAKKTIELASREQHT